MALTGIISKDVEKKPSKLERAAQIFGIANSIAGAAGGAYDTFKPTASAAPMGSGADYSALNQYGGMNTNQEDVWARLLSKMRIK